MSAERETYTCARCGTAFPTTSRHIELVRRDFVEVPRPSGIERLFVDCWRAYVEEFLDGDLDGELDAYDA